VSEKLVWWIVGIVAVLLLGAALWGPIVSNVEHPKFKAAERSGNIEIRDYAPMIVAEAEVKGERREAISEGFRIIADYIFGNNTAAQNVPMTAPVTQQGSEKIAMTAPVTQKSRRGPYGRCSLVLLASFHLDATRLGFLCLGKRQRNNAIAHLGFDLVLINLARNPKTAPEWTDIVFAVDGL
jgi:hypothetical protein